MDKGTIIIGVLTIVVFGGIIYMSGADERVESVDEINIEGLQRFTRTDRSHTNQSVQYDQVPPVGGSHSPTWLDCNAAVYDTPVDTEKAVHALEHGAVWISYGTSTATSTVETLKQKVTDYTFLSPVPKQTSPIKLTAWGHQLAVKRPTDARIDTFLSAFSQGPQTPEPGATCDAPNGRSM
jgi:hypothetical protein